MRAALRPNCDVSGPYSIVSGANSTLGARRPADLSTIAQMAAHIDAQVEFLRHAHVCSRTGSDSDQCKCD